MPAARNQRVRSRLAEDDDVAAVLEHQLEVASSQRPLASTSGPRPATPRGPTRPLSRPTARGDPVGDPPATGDRPGLVDRRLGLASLLAPRNGHQHLAPLGHSRAPDPPRAPAAPRRRRRPSASGAPPRRSAGAAPARGSTSVSCSPVSGPSATASQPQRRRRGGEHGEVGEERIGEPRPVRARPPQRDLRAASPRRLRAGRRAAAPAASCRAARRGRAGARSSSSSARSSCWPETASGQLELDRDRLPHRPRPQRLVARPAPAAAPAAPAARSDRRPRRAAAREPPEGGDPEPLELVGEVVGLILAETPAEQRDRQRRPGTRLRLPSGTTAEHRRPRRRRSGPGRLQTPGAPASRGHPRKIHLGRPLQHALDPSPEAAQAARPRRTPRRRGPTRPPRRFPPAAAAPPPRSARPAPDPGGSGPARGSARAPLPSCIPGRSPNLSAGSRDLPDQLRGAGLGGERRRPPQDFLVRDCGDQPEAGDQGACDGHRTYVRIPA